MFGLHSNKAETEKKNASVLMLLCDHRGQLLKPLVTIEHTFLYPSTCQWSGIRQRLSQICCSLADLNLPFAQTLLPLLTSAAGSQLCGTGLNPDMGKVLACDYKSCFKHTRPFWVIPVRLWYISCKNYLPFDHFERKNKSWWQDGLTDP